LAAGDRILEIEGFPAVDRLDVFFYESGSRIALTVVSPSGSIRKVLVDKEEDEPLGIAVPELRLR